MRTSLLWGMGLGLVVGSLIPGGSAGRVSDAWVVKRAQQLGMVRLASSTSGSPVSQHDTPVRTARTEPVEAVKPPATGKPPETPSSPPQSKAQPPAPAPKAPAAAPKPSPRPAAAASTPQPVPQPQPPTRPEPKTAAHPLPSPAQAPARPAETAPSRQVAIPEDASIREIFRTLEQAGVASTAEDRDLVTREVRSGRRFVAGTYTLSPGQTFEEVIKRITSPH